MKLRIQIGNMLKTAVLLLLSVTFALGVAEAVYRYYLSRKAPSFPPVGIENAVYHHDLKPNFSGPQRFGTEVAYYVTNNMGFRDREMRTVNPNHSRYRLIFIGDSFTEGVGVNYDDTFVGIIQRARPDMDILNAGVASYAPVLENLKIKNKLLGLKPDHIVMLVDPSDIQDSIVYHYWLKHKDKPQESTLKTLLQRTKFLTDVIKRISPHFFLDPSLPFDPNGKVWLTYYEERGMWLQNKQIYDKWGRQGLLLLLNDIDDTINICKKHAIKLTVVIYPWPQHIKDKNYLVDYQGEIKQLCMKNGVNLIDLFDVFTPATLSTHFIVGDIHWNKKGHELVANTLLKRLKLP
jgi:GDSL-like Lipase/Acylhydrolase family